MTDHQFDQFFKDRLGNHSSPVPEDMWQRIQEKKKDRPVGLFFWLGAGLILLAFSTAGYFLLQSGKANQKALAASTPSSPKISVAANKSKDKVLAQDANGNAAASAPVENTKQPGTVIHSGINKITKATQQVTHHQTLINTTVALQRLPLSAVATDAKQDKHQPSVSILQGNISLNHAPVSSANTNFVNAVPLNKDSSVIALPVLTAINTAVPAVTIGSITDSSATAAAAPVKSEVKKDRKLHGFTAEIYVSPDIAFKQSSTTDLTGLMLVQQGKQATRQLLSYSFGLRLGVLVSKHFSLKSGLQYSRVNEQFVYTDYNATRVIPLITERTITSVNGANTIRFDTTSLLQAGSRKVTTNNHYRSIDIPLLAGYETGNENLNLYVNAGPVINLYSWYSGTTINSSLQPESIASSGIYKSNTGLSLYLSLGIRKKINTRWQVFGEPYFRYRLGSITSSSVPFQQRIHTAGIQLGLRYKF